MRARLGSHSARRCRRSRLKRERGRWSGHATRSGNGGHRLALLHVQTGRQAVRGARCHQALSEEAAASHATWTA